MSTETIKNRETTMDPETAKLQRVFRPRSIAVIGASSRRTSISYRILHNIIDYGFNGKVFPVNPRADVIHSIKCYASVVDIPDEVDLAIIVVPRDKVLEEVEHCGRKGVASLIVVSSGFREVGPEGAALEQELAQKVKSYGMRMIGPNCYGVLNTNPEVLLNATFGKHHPDHGKIAFMSQSGALGQIIMEYALNYGVGFSQMASVGNKADVSGNDLLLYWQDDPEAEIILLYLESFGNPRRFSQVTRRLTKRKPIIAVKAGRTAAGARATVSHTGALAGLDLGVDALFDQCGIVRVESVEELFDVTVAMANQPIPRGRRVAILTNAGGPAVMATDAVGGEGLVMADLLPETQARMRDALHPNASVANPVDMIASAGPEEYRVAMEALLADPGVDALLVIYVPPVMIDTAAVMKSIGEASEGTDKTILGCIMGLEQGEISAGKGMGGRRIPAYMFPESAVRSLSAMIRYGEWRDREEGDYPRYDVDRARVSRIIESYSEEGERQIVGGKAMEILEAYGVPVARSIVVRSHEELVKAAADLGFPLVMKAASSEILHKTDVRGVILDVRNEEELLGAYLDLDARIREHLGVDEPTVVMLQEMIRGGTELVMGMSTDPVFGPLLMFGLGGIYVEYLKDVSFRIIPISDLDAKEMITGLRGYPLLTGFRGAPPVDLRVIQESLLRLSQLVSDFDQIVELDVNPFIASSEAQLSRAVDARIILRTIDNTPGTVVSSGIGAP